MRINSFKFGIVPLTRNRSKLSGLDNGNRNAVHPDQTAEILVMLNLPGALRGGG
ncbi:hypothetical protein [Methylomonas koyamae]|uniref:hypothetical protein n=1 Tax=Methylomonas koyamae TaxID=702114 RepID=UPI000B314713|nr:hypothetical protein [Methylomonas koyamae]